MDKVLNNNLKRFNKLNEMTKKGSIKSLYKQIELGKICEEGYTYWKQNKKALAMDRDALLKMYDYGKTYFGQLRKASKIAIEDVERYIESVGNEPTTSIPDLLKFMKPDTNDKPKTIMTFSQAKTDDDEGLSVRIDENFKVTTKSDIESLLDAIHCLNKAVESMREDKQLANVELIESVEFEEA
tara:strand:- start:213 stop:764 length:552 start_codon:yes stop_codon:yes gene_type:complete